MPKARLCGAVRSPQGTIEAPEQNGECPSKWFWARNSSRQGLAILVKMKELETPRGLSIVWHPGEQDGARHELLIWAGDDRCLA